MMYYFSWKCSCQDAAPLVEGSERNSADVANSRETNNNRGFKNYAKMI